MKMILIELEHTTRIMTEQELLVYFEKLYAENAAPGTSKYDFYYESYCFEPLNGEVEYMENGTLRFIYTDRHTETVYDWIINDIKDMRDENRLVDEYVFAHALLALRYCNCLSKEEYDAIHKEYCE